MVPACVTPGIGLCSCRGTPGTTLANSDPLQLRCHFHLLCRARLRPRTGCRCARKPSQRCETWVSWLAIGKRRETALGNCLEFVHLHRIGLVHRARSHVLRSQADRVAHLMFDANGLLFSICEKPTVKARRFRIQLPEATMNGRRSTSRRLTCAGSHGRVDDGGEPGSVAISDSGDS